MAKRKRPPEAEPVSWHVYMLKKKQTLLGVFLARSGEEAIEAAIAEYRIPAHDRFRLTGPQKVAWAPARRPKIQRLVLRLFSWPNAAMKQLPHPGKA